MAASTPEGIAERRNIRTLFVILGISLAIIQSLLGVWGDWLAYLLMSLLNTPILAVCVAAVYESPAGQVGSTIKGRLNPAHASWMFLFGDVALALAGTFLALDWKYYNGLVYIDKMVIGCLGCWALGLGVAWAFREKLDKPGWAEQNTLDRRDAPSKLYHDFAVYPSMFASLLVLGIPTVTTASSWSQPWVYLALTSILIWLAMFIHDGKGLDTWWLHALVDYDIGMRVVAPAGFRLPGELTVAEGKAATKRAKARDH